MGGGVVPQQYRADNPFAPKQTYRPDNPFAPKEEDQKPSFLERLREIASQALRGSAESVLATAKQGVALAEHLPKIPESMAGANPALGAIAGARAVAPKAREAVERQVGRVAETYGNPTTTAGTVARVVGRLGTDVAQFAGPGELLRVGGALPATTRLGRLAQNVVAGAPVDVLQAATPETSIYPMLTGQEGTYPKRLATELGADVLASGALEALSRAPRVAEEVAPRPRVGRGPERRVTEVPVAAERRVGQRRTPSEMAAEANDEMAKMEAAINESKRLAAENEQRVAAAREELALAGKPHNEAAIQGDLLGRSQLVGGAQTELLSATAGVPTARLRQSKIQPEEVARVRRAGAEPAGERPEDLFTTPESDFRSPAVGSRKSIGKLSDDQLVERYVEIEDRLSRNAENLARAETGNWGTWTAKEQRSRNKLLRGQITNDNGTLARVAAEMQRRGIAEEGARERFYERVGMEAGGAHPAVVQALSGGAAGATAGAVVAPEGKKKEGAVVGGLAGAGLVTAARALGRSGTTAAPSYLADPDVQTVLGTVARGTTPTATLGGLVNAGQTTARRLYTKVFDEAYPLERFGREVGGSRQLQQEVARARGWRGSAAQTLRDNFQPVVQSTKGHEEGVVALTKAQRALELLDAGLQKTDVPRDVLEQTVKKLEAVPEVKAGADALRQYYRSLLDRKLAEGVIDQTQYNAIVASGQYYVPFLRDFGVERVAGGMGREGKLVSSRTGVRRMDEEMARAATVDPFEQAIRDTFETERRVAKQRVTNIVAGIVEADPQAARPFIREVPNNTRGKLGGVVQANVGGSRKSYEVVDPDLYDAWGAFEPYTGNLLVRILRYPKTWLREGVTALPDFGIANAIRDNVMSAIQYSFPGKQALAGAAVGAGVGAATGDHAVSGAAKGAALGLGLGAIAPHIARTLDAMRDITGALGGDRQLYEEWLREGGAGFGFYVRNSGDARKVLAELTRTGVQASDVVSPNQWWKALQGFNRAIEEAPRVARYKYLKAQGVGIPEAIASSRDISLDFARIGSDMKGMSAMTAFFNAQVQGWDKLVRMLKQPKTWALGAGMITAPSIALWTINKDNEEYWNRPLWERNLFWLVPKGGGEGFWRIPKPFEVGFLFASIPERILDYLHQKDPEALKTALADIGGQYGLSGLIPTAVQPLIENVADFDFFTRRHVNPEQYANVPPEMQSTDRTSTVAMKIGEATGTSPSKVEHLIRGYTGSLGSEVLDETSRLARKMGLDTRPGPAEPRAPLVGRFQTRQTNLGEREIAIRRKWKKADASYQAVRRLTAAGRKDDARKYIENHRDELLQYTQLTALKATLDDVTELRHAISRSSLPAERRRAALTQINQRLAQALAQIQP